MTPEDQKAEVQKAVNILAARIMATMMGAPGAAIFLRGATNSDFATIVFGLMLMAIAHGWFLLLVADRKKA